MKLTTEQYKNYEAVLEKVLGLKKTAVINDGAYCYFTLYDLKNLNALRRHSPFGKSVQKLLAQLPAEADAHGKPVEYDLLGLLRESGLQLRQTIKETPDSLKEYNTVRIDVAKERGEALGAVMQTAKTVSDNKHTKSPAHTSSLPTITNEGEVDEKPRTDKFKK